jgi:hypothetical protein
VLTAGDIRTIADKAWIHDHDWELSACLFGEPFLEDDFLYFWDGSRLTFCGWPLSRDLLGQELQDIVRDEIGKLMLLFKPMTVEVWGPGDFPLDGVLGRSYNLVSTIVADPDHVNLQIELPSFRMPRNTAVENAGHAGRLGYHCIVQNPGFLTWEHFRLVETFLERRDLSLYDRAYSAVMPALARFPGTRLFSAFGDSGLLGFKVMRELNSDLVISVSSYYQKGVKFVSDFLNHAIIAYYRDSSFRILDMGYSGHRKLLEYKMHWKPTINNGPYWERTYTHGSHRPSGRYPSWWIRDLLEPVLRFAGSKLTSGSNIRTGEPTR